MAGQATLKRAIELETPLNQQHSIRTIIDGDAIWHALRLLGTDFGWNLRGRVPIELAEVLRRGSKKRVGLLKKAQRILRAECRLVILCGEGESER